MMHFDNVNSINLNDPEYFEILSGLWSGKKPPFTKAGVIRNTNFTASGEIDYSDVAWLDVETKQLAKRKLKYGDIIIERSGGGPKQPVGRVVQFRREDGIFSFSNFTTTVRVKKFDDLDPLFAFYILLELYQSGRTEDIQRRTTGLRNLDFKAYKERALFPLISRREQHHIAYMLSTVQTAIEQQERLIKLTRELKSALMHKLFTGGLHGEKQKMTEIGPVPESWKVLPLDELLTRTQYGLSIRGEDAGKYGILRMTNQTDGKISTEKMQFIDLNEKNFENYRLKRKDILFNRTNSLELVGRTAIFDIEGDYVFASYLIRLNTNNERLDAFFLNHYLNWEDTQRRLKTIALRAVSQSNINATRLRSFQIPVPPLKEQAEIVLHVNTIINKIEIHQRKKQILEELFRALLNQLMTGQTRVNEIDLPGFS
ncbi:MAG TPA: restriction endonuclease subunit S [Smithellaceae bacterium]|nr:restriction endonuclease subunit S [Smithellaceae bacterium]HRT36357.1 restriction endonuclease subunit S [Smithellaceae bacterium]HRU27095.1 restriction endonuclease subunit S [Smithellaceae bacterium]